MCVLLGAFIFLGVLLRWAYLQMGRLGLFDYNATSICGTCEKQGHESRRGNIEVRTVYA